MERANARLKDEFGGRNVRVRGAAKVMAHLMFGVLALILGQALLFASVPVALYGLVVAAAFYVFVKLYEEPTLARTFGDDLHYRTARACQPVAILR